jgi:hypothetical protein
MSASTTPRKLMPLNLVGEGRVNPHMRERPHVVSLKVTSGEYSALLDFTNAVKRRTGLRVTQQGIARTALRLYLLKHSAWTDCLPDSGKVA